MYVSFDQIDKNAKSWVYSLEKKCNNHIQDLHFFLKDLCENWKSHNQPVKASYIIYEDSFIILFAENSISGCSIDNSNKLIREKLNDLNIDIMSNSKIGIFNDGKLVYYDRLSLINKIKEGKVDINKKMINTTIQTKEDFNKKWILEINNSWLVNFIK
tara:strand:- start:722 stop:1195 length:474 start_codon:yes stop_codon:yes gene_type:complete